MVVILRCLLLQVTLTTQGSFDSRWSLAQVFTKTGTFKGQVVALKLFNKKNIDISRVMKKEMKIVSLHTNIYGTHVLG